MNRSIFISVVVAVFTRVTLAQGVLNPCAGLPDGVFVNEFTECAAFFTCFRGEAVRGTCPDGFVFNEEQQICDHPWNVKCLICPEESAISLEPTLVPIEGECSFYTLCFQGVGTLRECAEGLLFDADQAVCDFAENVDCEIGVCPSNLNPNIPTFLPDPTDCSRYFICVGGIAEGAQCAASLLFNPETRRCEVEETVECIEGSIPSPTTCPSTGLHIIGNPANCVSYFVCLNGVQSDAPVNCAPGLIFDVTESLCNIPNENSRCADGSNPNPVPVPPLPEPTTPEVPESKMLLYRKMN